MGGVLSQVIDGVERPIIFISRRLTPAEQKWAIREKEAVGIIWALECFRHSILSLDFCVQADHRTLELLNNANQGRFARWALRLSEFSPIQVDYREGAKHGS